MILTLLYGAALFSCLTLIGTLMLTAYLDHKNEQRFTETMREIEKLESRKNSFVQLSFYHSAMS